VIPYLEDSDFTLYQGDVLEVLKQLPAESVHMCVTSPPYWGLRDYGTGSWDGGDPDCDHLTDRFAYSVSEKQASNKASGSKLARETCGKCGASRVDNQLGLEPTPEAYIERMVAVFREVRRVLRSDGTCWVNMGDSYAGGGRGGQSEEKRSENWQPTYANHGLTPNGLKPKDLCMVPARLALALQADGWWLRSQIVWSKPNPMPESVTDRPTSSYELVYLLTKSPRYFFDAEAVREPFLESTLERSYTASKARAAAPKNDADALSRKAGGWEMPSVGRNVRNVWEIATQPYPEAHFATYPEELVRRCVLAGCPEGGTVLDPFSGSGTTALVSRKHGRRCIGIELNPDYCALAARRLSQLSLLGEPA